MTKQAGRDLKSLQKILDDKQFLRIDAKIQSLRDDPRPTGSEKLSGEDCEYRVRDGDYRIVYSIDDDKRQVIIGRVRDRKDVYRH